MIRDGKIKDAEQIANIKIENYKKTYANIFSDEFLSNMNIEEEKEKYINGLKNRKVLVYYDDDKILGYIYYGKRKNHKEILPTYDGEIYAIYVNINFKNKGIGTQLIKSALNDLIKECKKIILWCMSDNHESIEFYKKRSFKEVDKVKVNIGGNYLYESALTFDFQESNN